MCVCSFNLKGWRAPLPLLFLTSVHLPFEAPIWDFIKKKKQTAAIKKHEGRRRRKNSKDRTASVWKLEKGRSCSRCCQLLLSAWVSHQPSNKPTNQVIVLWPCCCPSLFELYRALFALYLSPALFLSCCRSPHSPPPLLDALLSAVCDHCQLLTSGKREGKVFFIHLIEVLSTHEINPAFVFCV